MRLAGDGDRSWSGGVLTPRTMVSTMSDHTPSTRAGATDRDLGAALSAGQPNRARRGSRVWAWIMLAVLLATTVGVWLVRRTDIEEATQERFDNASDEIAGPRLEQAFAPYADLVQTMANRATAGLSREQFLGFVGEQQLEDSTPATYVAVVTERVPDAELSEFGERIGEFTSPNFGSPTLQVPDVGSGDHEVILHASPDATRFNAIGLDVDFLISDESLFERESGGPAMIGAIDFALVESLGSGGFDEGAPQQWLAVIAMRYASDDGAHTGISAVVVHLDDIIGGLAEEAPGVGTQVEGETIAVPGVAEGGKRILATEPTVPASDIVESGFSSVRDSDVLGAPWTLTFRELSGFEKGDASNQWIWLGSGILVSLLLFGLVYSQLRSRDRAYDMVDEATAELRVSEERMRQAFENEKELAQRLQESDDLKAEFVSMASHELRTPLTAATAFVDTVLLQWDRLDEEKRKELLGRASGNAKELTRLIDQLLASVRLDDAAMAIDPEPLDLAPLVAGVVEPITPLLAEHELEVDIAEGIAVMAGSEAFGHVLGNLLTNAAKYSEPGTTIRVSARRMKAEVDGDERDEGMVGVSVSDEGDGIPPDDLDRVFDRFFQSTASPRSSRAGLGVGLAIVRRYVEAQGGEISVASTVGEGSTFTFTLPDAAVPPEPARSVGSDDEPART